MTAFRPGLGDLAQSTLLRGGQSRLKADILRLSGELTTGKRQGLDPRLAGDVTPLLALQRSRAVLTPWQGAATEARIATDAVQAALSMLADSGQAYATKALTVGGMGSEADVALAAGEARDLFRQSVSVLNGTAAGRSLFAGAVTDSPALAPADDMLADILAATAGAASAADVVTAVEAWFAPGGGFETSGYLGSAAPSRRVGPTDSLGPLPTAADPAVRAALAGLAIAAVAADAGAGLAASVRKDLVAHSGEAMLSAASGMVALQAAVGTQQERIADVEAQLSSEAHALDLAIDDLASVDPYETATRLEATQVQLETLFAVTARLSSMGLAGYLR